MNKINFSSQNLKLNFNVAVSLVTSLLFGILYLKNLNSLDFVIFTTSFAIFQFSDNFSNLKLYEYPKKILLHDDYNKIKNEIGNLLVSSMIITIPVAIISVSFAYFIYFETLFNQTFFSISIYLIFSLIVSPFVNILRAYILFSNKLNEYIGLEIKINLIFRTILLLILYFYVENLLGALIVNFVTRLILLPGLFLFLKKSKLLPIFSSYNKLKLKMHINFSSRVLIAESYTQLVYALIAYILLNKYNLEIVSTVMVAVSIIQRLPQVIYTYLLIYNQKLTNLIKSPRLVVKLIISNIKYTLYIYAFLFLISLMFEDTILNLVRLLGEVGNSFIYILLILVFFEGLLFICRLGMYIMQIISVERIIFNNSIISLLITIALTTTIYFFSSNLIIDLLSFVNFYLILIILNHKQLNKIFFNK